MKLNTETGKKAIGNLGKKAGQFASVGVGLGVGSFAMKQIPGPWYVPGLVAILAAAGIFIFSENDFIDAAAYGLGGAGVLHIAKKAGTQFPALAFLGDKVPALGDDVSNLYGYGNDALSIPEQGNTLLSGFGGADFVAIQQGLLS